MKFSEFLIIQFNCAVHPLNHTSFLHYYLINFQFKIFKIFAKVIKLNFLRLVHLVGPKLLLLIKQGTVLLENSNETTTNAKIYSYLI